MAFKTSTIPASVTSIFPGLIYSLFAIEQQQPGSGLGPVQYDNQCFELCPETGRSKRSAAI